MVVNGTRDNEQKLKDRRFPLKIREDFSTVRVTQHWHSLPRDIVESPFLEMFKNPLDIALGNRCKWPCFSGEVGADDSQRFLPNLTTLVLWFCTFVPLFFFHSTSSTANGGIPPLANSCTFTSHDCFKRNSETMFKQMMEILSLICQNQTVDQSDWSDCQSDCGVTDYNIEKDNVDSYTTEESTTQLQLARHNSCMHG